MKMNGRMEKMAGKKIDFLELLGRFISGRREK